MTPELKTTPEQRAKMRTLVKNTTPGKWILHSAPKGSNEDWWIVVEAEDDDIPIVEALNNRYYMKPEHKIPICDNRRGNLPYIEAVQPETVSALLDDADLAAALAEQVAQLQADQQFAVDILTGGYSAFTLREAVFLIDGKIKTYCKSMEDLQAENPRLQSELWAAEEDIRNALAIAQASGFAGSLVSEWAQSVMADRAALIEALANHLTDTDADMMEIGNHLYTRYNGKWTVGMLVCKTPKEAIEAALQVGKEQTP